MNKMAKNKRLILFYILSLALILLDQVTKHIIVSKMGLNYQKDIIPGFLSFHYVRNTGSAFSFLADNGWGIYILSAISLIMSVVIAFLLVKASKNNFILMCVSFVLLFSGAIGNLVDRFRLRYVVDFIRFDFGSYTFPIFNVADICAVCGTILFIFVIILRQDQLDKILPEKEK